MQFTNNKLPGIVLVEPKLYEDERGFFFESYHKRLFDEHKISLEFVQDNHSRSRQRTLRGMHYQIRHPQGKLVRVIIGEIYDVAVDLRKSSHAFGEWTGIYLSAQNKKQLYVPPGFAHGFYVMSEWAEVLYKTTDYYVPEWERTLLWNDAQINISWPLIDKKQPLLSVKDTAGTPFDQIEVYD